MTVMTLMLIVCYVQIGKTNCFEGTKAKQNMLMTARYISLSPMVGHPTQN